MNKRQLKIRILSASSTFVLGVAAAGLVLIFRPSPLREIKGLDIRTKGPLIRTAALSTTAIEVAPQPAPAAEEQEETNPPVSRARLPEGHLLEVGDFHGEEVKASTGEKWLGLFVTRGGESTLAHAILNVKTVKDEMVDGEGEKTGKRVSVKRQPAPVFLVKGATTLLPGPVITIFREDEPATLGSGSDIELKLGAQVYHLKVPSGGRNAETYIAYDDAKLVLDTGEAEQVLYDLGGTGQGAEAYWSLIWAGDADGDGKLDLYVNVSYHYNVTQHKLFLSSRAKGGELVREEAELNTSGC